MERGEYRTLWRRRRLRRWIPAFQRPTEYVILVTNVMFGLLFLTGSTLIIGVDAGEGARLTEIPLPRSSILAAPFFYLAITRILPPVLRRRFLQGERVVGRRIAARARQLWRTWRGKETDYDSGQ